MNNKQQVAILYGGKSVEHEISINSARNIAEYIDRDQYDVGYLGISPSGEWFLMPDVSGDFSTGNPVSLELSGQRKGFRSAKGTFYQPDILFPVLHGTDGEDGSIQGLLTSMDLPFVGTGVLGSAMSMNKLYSKRLMQTVNVPVGQFFSYTVTEREEIHFSNIKGNLGLPFMAKAANLGSSVGVFKIKEEKDFATAVEEIFQYDHTLIFEEFVDGRELECAVMGNRDPQASLPGEIVVSSEYEFYTYEAKYLDPKAARIVVPADVDQVTAEKIRELSVKTFKILHCEDFARVDLFLKADGTILINEINTIPGFTNSSMFPMMWKERGLDFRELISRLIELAQERYLLNSQIIKVRKT